MTTFDVSIVTQEKVFLDAEVTALQIPGGAGYLGVLANHAPLLTTIVEGTLSLTLPDKSVRRFAVDGGFMEVADNQATILPDSIEELV
jgi:F-type H+-transporting ATPase subunit epsilon